MKFVIQRAKEANVKVDEKIVGQINKGLVVLVGIKEGDNEEIADYMINKMLNLRIFTDENYKMNLSLKDVQGEILLISQFTLYGNCQNGNRPSFTEAAKPDIAEKLYNYIVEKTKEQIQKVETGIFAAHMEVSLINDGPVTIILEK